jgi:hypothetical protein
MRPLLLLICALLGACAGAQVQPPVLLLGAPRAEILEEERPAELRFGWRAGDRARVTLRRTDRMLVGEQKTENSYAATWTLEVAPHPAGLALGMADLELLPTRPPPRRETALELASLDGLRLIVSPEGEALRAEGLDVYEQRLASAHERGLVEAPAPIRAVKAKMAEQEEMSIFNVVVGFWAGGDLGLGDEHLYEDTDSIVRFTVVRRLPCAKGEAPARCVELRYEQELDRNYTEQQVAPLLAAYRTLDPAAELSIGESGIEQRVIAEEATLRPLKWQRDVAIRMSVRFRGEVIEGLETTRTETRTWKWDEPSTGVR